jgi:hypothetical protein
MQLIIIKIIINLAIRDKVTTKEVVINRGRTLTGARNKINIQTFPNLFRCPQISPKYGIQIKILGASKVV